MKILESHASESGLEGHDVEGKDGEKARTFKAKFKLIYVLIRNVEMPS